MDQLYLFCEKGKKRWQKSKASFTASEKTKIFNKLPIATRSLEKGREEEKKKKAAGVCEGSV